jgi:hypothetical protein
VVGALCVSVLTACLSWKFVASTPIYMCVRCWPQIASQFGLEYEAKEVYFGAGCRVFVFAFSFTAWCDAMWCM